MEDPNNQTTPLRTRSSSENFNWDLQCFICGEKCDPKRDSNSKGYSRSLSFVEQSNLIDHKTIYSKVLDFAYKRHDERVINRLPNGDLVAVKAKYHRKKG